MNNVNNIFQTSNNKITKSNDENVILIHLPFKNSYIQKIIFLLILIILALIIYYLKKIIFLFIISFLFAYILNPFVIWIEKYLKNKTISILTVYLILFSIFMLLIIPAMSSLTSEIANIPNKMRSYSENFKGIYRNIEDFILKYENTWWMETIKKYIIHILDEREEITKLKNVEPQYTFIKETSTTNEINIINMNDTNENFISNINLQNDLTNKFLNKFNYFLKNSPKIEAFFLGIIDIIKENLITISQYFLSWLGNFTILIIHYALVPLLSYYFLADFSNLWIGFQKILPFKFKNKIIKIVCELDNVIGTFLRGQLIICFIVGTAFSFVLSLIGVDFAFIIGPIAGICNIIYYLGPTVAAVPSVIIAFLKWGLTFKALYKIFFIITSILIIHLIDAFIFQPFLAEKSFSMHPLTLMFLLFVGLQVYGILGMFLAIPLYGMCKVIYNNCKIVYA